MNDLFFVKKNQFDNVASVVQIDGKSLLRFDFIIFDYLDLKYNE